MIYVLYLFIAALIVECTWALLTRETRGPITTLIKATIGGIIIFGTVVLLGGARPAEQDWYSLEETHKALEYVIEKKIPKRCASKISISKTSQAFFDAQNAFNVPSIFLVSIGYYESKYSLKAVGDGGKSVGIMQVGKRGRWRCRKYCGLMQTENEQIMCGGCWLRKNIEWCKTLNRGFVGYASGRCLPSTRRVKNVVQRRFRLWYHLNDNVRNVGE